jgi:PTS system mannose-specific IIA component
LGVWLLLVAFPYLETGRAQKIAASQPPDAGKGVIVLTDMFGGTPCNLAISLLENGRVEVVAGVNLPMLVKLARIRSDSSLETAVVKAQEAGRKYINIASQILSG